MTALVPVDEEIVFVHRCLDRLTAVVLKKKDGPSVPPRPHTAHYVGEGAKVMNVAHRRAMGRMVEGADHVPVEGIHSFEECDVLLIRGSTHRMVVLIKEELKRHKTAVVDEATRGAQQRIAELEQLLAAERGVTARLTEQLSQALDPENAHRRWINFVQGNRRNTLLQLQLGKQVTLEDTYHRTYRHKLFNEISTRGKWSRFETLRAELTQDFGDEIDSVLEEYAPTLLNRNVERDTPMSTKKVVKQQLQYSPPKDYCAEEPTSPLVSCVKGRKSIMGMTARKASFAPARHTKFVNAATQSRLTFWRQQLSEHIF